MLYVILTETVLTPLNLAQTCELSMSRMRVAIRMFNWMNINHNLLIVIKQLKLLDNNRKAGYCIFKILRVIFYE